ncbi:heavy metal translocatin [Choiromyces venosus 120613-1]|uniref:P-type Cu(+) transporter n=1 Tax=Choiromyces venosus 120613-1 TaxID=1336337 RepID=A0A3N4K1L3_9PEZI|nr:heavy metal translocatin [Choiromyces venosus 120613-1]
MSASKPEDEVPLMDRGKEKKLAQTTISVGGMTCGACTSAIEGGFTNLDGLESFTLRGKMVLTWYDRIEDRGFDANIVSSDIKGRSPRGRRGGPSTPGLVTTTVKVEGMTCASCSSSIESAFKDVDGVQSIAVDLGTDRAVATHDSAKISAEKVAEIIEDRGFDVEIVRSEPVGGYGRRSISDSTPHLATTTISVDGMTCGACTAAIEGGFENVAGIGSFTVSLITERAVAVHDPNVISAERIAEIIDDRGFEATIISTDLHGSEDRGAKEDTIILKIFGMSSEEDAIKLENTFRTCEGVIDAGVTLPNAKAVIEYYPSKTGIRNLVDLVESLNMNALPADMEDNSAQLESLAKTKEIKQWQHAFWFSLYFAVPVFLISMIIPMWFKGLDKYIGQLPIIPGLYLGDIICLLLTIPVQFGIGLRFYRSAFKSLKHWSATMDVLVVLGTSAAFFFSIIAMLMSIMCSPYTKPGTVFDTSTMLITFISLGRYLENRAKGQTSKALSRLMSLVPSMATIYVDPEKAGLSMGNDDNAGEERTIPTELIQVNDIVIVRPGDKIPADGTVVAGESYVDESMVTGEAMPILKRKGALLIGGTVNSAGRLEFQVTRAGRDTQLSQIVKLVQEAQTSRAPIQRMADILAGYFVPSVIALGLITFIGWMILSHVLDNRPAIFDKEGSGGTFMVCLKLCISVIVFACPCALGLSTPTAVMVGTGVGAEQGILVKGGAALETATKITQVVLDKTGTITIGRMTVAVSKQSSIWESTEWTSRLWWLLVGITESGSEHPVGRAITTAARERLDLGVDGVLDGSITEFKAVVGRGVEATIKPAAELKAYNVLIGNTKFLNESGVEVPEEAVNEARNADGNTYVFVAIDGEYAGLVALSDELKPDAKYAVEALRRLGVKIAMVTGDQEAPAHQVAKQVGIPFSMVYSSVSPDEKQKIIKSLQDSGEIVAMVGDGINDSPALATANVGIAMSSGTDVAMEAADIVLMRPQSLLDIPAALHLAKTIFGRIKLNLLWACFYNILGLPFAMGFFLPLGLHLHPMAAGAAMAASSVSVVCSSLLLKFWRKPTWMTVEGMKAEEASGLATPGSPGNGWKSRWRRWRIFGARAGDGYTRVGTEEV